MIKSKANKLLMKYPQKLYRRRDRDKDKDRTKNKLRKKMERRMVPHKSRREMKKHPNQIMLNKSHQNLLKISKMVKTVDNSHALLLIII